MNILTIRTDQPEAYLAVFKNGQLLDELKWQAHRELAATLHTKLKELLDRQGLELKDIGGIVAYEGPGSFTGLRIGLTTANALAYSLGIPIVATGGEDWQAAGIKLLTEGQNQGQAMPVYGGKINITSPRRK